MESIFYTFHESIAYISSLGLLNSLICLFVVVVLLIILFVFSCHFFSFFPSASLVFALHVVLVIRKKNIQSSLRRKVLIIDEFLTEIHQF